MNPDGRHSPPVLLALALQALPLLGLLGNPDAARSADDVPPNAHGAPNLLAVLGGNEFRVRDFAYSPDGKKLAARARPARLRVWKAETGEVVLDLNADRKLGSLVFSPDGQYLLAAGYTGIRKWRVSTGAELPETETNANSHVLISPGGPMLVTWQTPRVQRWEIQSACDLALIDEFTIPAGSIKSVAISPDSSRVAISTDSGAIHLSGGGLRATIGIQLPPKPFLGTIFPSQVWASEVAFHPNGHVLENSASHLRQWHPGSGIQIPTHFPLSAANFTPDGRYTVSRRGDSIVLWELETGQPALHIEKPNVYSTGLAIAPDFSTIALFGRTSFPNMQLYVLSLAPPGWRARQVRGESPDWNTLWDSGTVSATRTRPKLTRPFGAFSNSRKVALSFCGAYSSLPQSTDGASWACWSNSTTMRFWSGKARCEA